MTSKNGTPTTTAIDPLISSSVATTSFAVESRLAALAEMVSSPTPSVGNPAIDNMLNKVRADLDVLTSTQSSEQEEIRKLLEKTLSREVWEHLQRQIEERIQQYIENNVAELVEVLLDKHVPKALRDEVDNQQTEMRSLRVNIYNSEARRANSSIKMPKHFNDELQLLLNSKGEKSVLFPKTVTDLLGMQDAKVFDLVKFYGMGDASTKSRTANTKWFLEHVGVSYQPHYLG